MVGAKPKIILLANTDWFLYNSRRSLAEALRKDGWEVVFVSPGGEYASRLQELGFRWIRFDFLTQSTNPMREIVVLARLGKLYKAERPALVHHFTIKCVLYGTLAARLAGGIKVVNSVTGMGHVFTDNGPGAEFLRSLVRFLYRLVAKVPGQRVVFENRQDLETFSRWGLLRAGSASVVRGAGVDCRRFSPDCRTPSDFSGPVRVLLASRLIKEKGVLEFLEAARIVRARQPQVEFLLAGGTYKGNPSSLSEEDVEAIRRERVVTYLGHVEDVPSLLNGCQIFVLPSYREGTPSSLLEAAACGKPVVASRIAGCEGIVQDGVNGFAVPVRDVGALCSAIEALACDPGRRNRFGLAGREIVLRHFDERLVIKKTLAIYHDLMRQR